MSQGHMTHFFYRCWLLFFFFFFTEADYFDFEAVRDFLIWILMPSLYTFNVPVDKSTFNFFSKWKMTFCHWHLLQPPFFNVMPRKTEILWKHICSLLILASIYSIIFHQGMSLSQPSKGFAEWRAGLIKCSFVVMADSPSSFLPSNTRFQE